jgi:subtilisin family serine protease
MQLAVQGNMRPALMDGAARVKQPPLSTHVDTSTGPVTIFSSPGRRPEAMETTRCKALLFAFLCGFLLLGTGVGPSLAHKARSDYVPGEVLVRFKKEAPKAGCTTAVRALGMEISRHFSRSGIHLVRIGRDDTVPDAIRKLEADPTVLYAEPNYILHATSTLPDDPLFSNLWGLHNTGQSGGTEDADVDAPEAWDVSTGSEYRVVCVIDTGVTYGHEDLAANMWKNQAELEGSPGVDDDGNGYVDDIYGINAITDTGDPMDDHGHGTHCAGTVAAVGNNGTGVTGVNWNARIMACKFLDHTGHGNSANAIKCLEYATAMGAEVTSNSYGGGEFSQAMLDAIEAIGDAGLLFVVAAGNDRTNTDLSPDYPSSYPCENVVSVAATDHDDDLASFSNYGVRTVDVAAPGVDIFSTFPPGAYLNSSCHDSDADGYGYCSGTSMACPHVAGLAALAMETHPAESHLEIKTRILRTADFKAHLENYVLTGARINAHRALTEIVTGPHLYDAHPDYGWPGVEVTLLGDGFGETQGEGAVLFYDGAPATVQSWSEFEIRVLVPEGSEAGPVVVSTDEGTSNSIEFEVYEPYYDQGLLAGRFIGGGQAMGWQEDEACWPYHLPFTFPFFDRDYTWVYVCSNGYLDFTNDFSDYTNTEQELISRVMAAPLWDDLRTDGPGEDIYIHQPAENAVAVRWVARTYDGEHPVDVEAVLYQDGVIEFNYGEGNTGLTPTIGMSKGDGIFYHLSAHNGADTLTLAETERYTPADLVCGDGDGDGYGNPSSPICPQPGEDCDDGNPNVHPGATEDCSNGLDDDCDGDVDRADAECGYSAAANAEASTFGAESYVGSGVVNQLLLVLLPILCACLIRLLRYGARKGI